MVDTYFFNFVRLLSILGSYQTTAAVLQSHTNVVSAENALHRLIKVLWSKRLLIMRLPSYVSLWYTSSCQGYKCKSPMTWVLITYVDIYCIHWTVLDCPFLCKTNISSPSNKQWIWSWHNILLLLSYWSIWNEQWLREFCGVSTYN